MTTRTKRQRKVANTGLPERLYAEPPKVFRLRVVGWIVKKFPGFTYDEIRDKYRELYPNIDIPMGKESIVRDCEVLEAREEIYQSAGDDRRRRAWYPC